MLLKERTQTLIMMLFIYKIREIYILGFHHLSVVREDLNVIYLHCDTPSSILLQSETRSQIKSVKDRM